MNLEHPYTKNAILSLIARNNLEQALFQVNTVLQAQNHKLIGTGILLSSQYFDIEEQICKRVISYENARIILNDITARLIKLIDIIFSESSCLFVITRRIAFIEWNYNST